MKQNEKQALEKAKNDELPWPHSDPAVGYIIESIWATARRFYLNDIIDALTIAESRKETGDYKKIIKWIEKRYELNK